MKKYQALLKTVAAVALASAAGAAMAATGDTQSLSVSASVNSVCKFTGTAPTLNFGALDPDSGKNISASATASFKCTKGVSANFTHNDGEHYSFGTKNLLADSGTDLIAYSIDDIASIPANGFGAAQTVTVKGNISYDAYKNAAAGTYKDAVTLSVSP